MSVFLLLPALTPWFAVYSELSDFALKSILLAFFIVVSMVCYVKFNRCGIYLVYFIAAIMMALPIAFYYSPEAQLHQANYAQLQWAQGKIPATFATRQEQYGRQKAAINYLDLGGANFDCTSSKVVQSAVDKILCQEIYQYAEQNAKIGYYVNNQAQKKPMLIQLETRILWTMAQAQAFYQQQWQTFWREFWFSIAWTSVPFALLYLWTKSHFQAAMQPETH